MVGTSCGTAPYERSWSERPVACSLVRGTRTFQPNSGFVSNQECEERCATCSPTTAITEVAVSTGAETGEGSTRAAFRSAAMVASVAVNERCRVVVPESVAQNAESGLRPLATSALAVAGSWASVVRTTSVVSGEPRSTGPPASSAAPSTKRTSVPLLPRSGTPA